MATLLDGSFCHGAYEDWSPQCRWIKTKKKYRKDTIFMHNHPGLGKLSGFCTCKRKHIQLMGSLTTLAAAYPEGLSEEVVGGIKDSFPNTPGPWGIPDGDERLSPKGSAADIDEANDEHPEVCLDALDHDQLTRPLHYLRPGSKPCITIGELGLVCYKEMSPSSERSYQFTGAEGLETCA